MISATPGRSQDISDSPDRYRQDVAGVRPQPEYDPMGVRLGGWTARLDANLSVGYNSNVFSRAEDAEADIYSRFRPSVRLNRDWGSNGISLGGNATLTRFKQRDDQNSNEYNIQSSGRIALGPSLTLKPSIEYARETEPRGSAGNRLVAGDPVYLSRSVQSLSGSFEGTGFAAEALVIRRLLRYQPVLVSGAKISQKFRDSNGIGARITVLHAVSPSISALAVLVADKVSNPHRAFCCARNAKGFAVLGGLRFDSAGLIAGQLAMGYRKRAFESSAPKLEGVTYDARIEWYPTNLMTFSFNADQEVRNSGIPGSNAALVSTQSARIDYELLRNLVLNLQAEHETSRYRNIATRSILNTLTFQATFTMRRALQLAASVTYKSNATNRETAANDFNAVQTGLNLRFRL